MTPVDRLLQSFSTERTGLNFIPGELTRLGSDEHLTPFGHCGILLGGSDNVARHACMYNTYRLVSPIPSNGCESFGSL